MNEEYKVKFVMTTKRYQHDKTDRPTLLIHSYHNYEEDKDFPVWNKDGEAEFSLADDKKQMYIMGTRDYYDHTTIVLNKEEAKKLKYRLQELINQMVD
jgi:hypothetical protein